MQLATHQSTLTIGNVAREQRMSVDLDAIAHIIKPLTDLYSDRILAFIREYSTNAWDSHVRAGVERPIEVTLPTISNQYFQVQDFGLGLSADDLADLYSVYGKSLNRTSDLAAGTFGFGSKSALAYADDFTIIAVKDGVRNVVQVVKDNDGVGVLRFLDQRTTDEGNGVTVRVPVKPSDRGLVDMKAREFYKYWDPGTVLVDGTAPNNVWEDDSNDTIYLDPDVLVQRDEYNDECFIVMGQVAYPVRRRDIPGAPSSVNVIARVPMGSVTFTPSREALKINETVTVATLTTLAQYLNDRLVPTMLSNLDKAPTPWDRYQRWNTYARRWGVTLPDDYGYYADRRYYTGRPAEVRGWDYAHGKRNTYAYTNYDFLSGTRNLVVTGVPFVTLTPVVKARIDAYCVSIGERRSATVLRTNPDFMEGYDKVVHYDDLPVIKRARGEAGPKKVGYTWFVHENGVTRSYEAAKPEGKKIAFQGHAVPPQFSLVPGVHYATLRANQIDKFQRTFPQARPWGAYRCEASAKALAAVTAEDRIFAALQQQFRWHSPLKGWRNIDDPDLRQIMEVATRGASSTYTAARSFVHTLSGFDPSGILSRYPLIGTWTGTLDEDAILYINHKYNTTIKPQEGTAS